MPPPQVNPKYVYKIVDSAPPSPLPAVFPPLALDEQDGFVHLSTARQVPLTADRFFASHQTLYLVKVRLADGPLAPLTKWETPPNTSEEEEQDVDNYFPHLYGSFGAAHIESVRGFERGRAAAAAGGGGGGGGCEECWKDVFAKGDNAEWLE